jgi:hypothetical protein
MDETFDNDEGVPFHRDPWFGSRRLFQEWSWAESYLYGDGARSWVIAACLGSTSRAVGSHYDIMGSSFLVHNDALSLSIDPCLARRFRAEVRELEVQFSSLICCRGRACHIQFCMNFLAV